jgi:uncharacterized Zn-binding protein involved in type VI secretion
LFEFLAGRTEPKFDFDQGMLAFVNRRRASGSAKTSLASSRKADYVCVRLGARKMSEKSYGPNRACRGWSLSFAILVIGLVAIFPRPASSGSKNDTTGAVSKAEPPVKQDGTPTHPYADASQCPSSTDVIIWPSGSSIPSLPPGISVCFVGGQSFNDSGSDVQVRQR